MLRWFLFFCNRFCKLDSWLTLDLLLIHHSIAQVYVTLLSFITAGLSHTCGFFVVSPGAVSLLAAGKSGRSFSAQGEKTTTVEALSNKIKNLKVFWGFFFKISSTLWGWRDGSVGRASDSSRSKDPRFEPRRLRQERKTNLWEFFRVKTVVLARCQCAQPTPCVYTHRIRMATYAR